MTAETGYSASAPDRKEIDQFKGPLVLEFGTDWCGYCQAAQPLIMQALSGESAVRHIKIEDGKGRLLGRSFAVKLWPTLVFMRDGQEITRLVRPRDSSDIRNALEQIV